MHADFLDQLAELALGSRLKRLSDRLMAEANTIYQAFGHSVQPRWFVLLALLHHKGRVGVVEAAESLGVSQPAVSQFSRDLEDRGWLKVVFDENDGRKRYLALTETGRREVDSLQTMWRAVEAAAKELCDEAGGDFYQSIQRFEKALNNKSLLSRAMEQVERSHE